MSTILIIIVLLLIFGGGGVGTTRTVATGLAASAAFWGSFSLLS